MSEHGTKRPPFGGGDGEAALDATSAAASTSKRDEDAARLVTRPLSGRETLPRGPDPEALSPGDLGMLRTEASHPRSVFPRDAPLSRGQSIGRYVIVDRLGAGGMGVVYRAFDPDLDRSVALKLVAVDVDDETEERSRLLREAQAMARLSHPNVIPVFDVGLQEQAVFVAMELVDGKTLTEWLAERTAPWLQIVTHFIEAGRGLAAAHEGGLIHRDFKPDNVMVGTDGRVRVLDFGLARGAANDVDLDDEDTAELRAISGSRISGGRSLDTSMTAAGTVMGTPAYMSPEQHLGMRVTAASDQFSFCVALWEALYGERPFEGQTLSVLAAHVVQGKLRDKPSGTNVPTFVHEALVRGLAVDDDKRHTSMHTLLAALGRDPRVLRRRVGVLVGGGAAILAIGSALGVHVGKTAAHRNEPALCTGSAAAMEGTWNDGRRDALAAAFEATGLSYAPPVWANAAARVDAYAAAWIDGRTAACQATRVTGEQSEARLDQRMLCLERHRTELDSLLTALSAPDDAVVERAIDAVRQLPPPDECADPTRLIDPAPLPDDPALVAAITDAQAVLAQVGAQVAVGHYASAKAALAPAVVTSVAVDHPPLTVEVRSWQADIEAAAGAPAAARKALQLAYTAATATDDVRMQASIAGELAFEFGYRAADAERGELWLNLGRALVRRGGVDEAQAARLDAYEGSTLVAAGDYTKAIAAHERALAYWRAQAPDSPSVARTLDDIGAAEVLLGKVDEAIAHHDEALAIRRRVYGDNHPVVAASERELGMSLSKAGRHDEARAPIERALKIHRETRGESNTHVATCLDDLGRIERQRGNLDAALSLHQQALPIWESLLGPSHPDVAVSLLGIGYTFVAAERPADAVPVQRRALRMFEATVGGEHPYVIYAANALGMALLSAGDPEGAIAPLTQALGLRGKVQVDPTLFGDTLYALGKAQWRTATTEGQRRDAREQVQAARDLFATQGERWTSELAKIDAWLAAPA